MAHGAAVAGHGAEDGGVVASEGEPALCHEPQLVHGALHGGGRLVVLPAVPVAAREVRPAQGVDGVHGGVGGVGPGLPQWWGGRGVLATQARREQQEDGRIRLYVASVKRKN